MTDYLMLTLAVALLACDFALSKLYQKFAGTSLRAGFAFNAILGALTAIVFFAIGGFSFHFSLYSCLMAFALAALGMSYTLFGFRILKMGSMALYSLFLMTGGMAIPYVWGLLFLDEPFSILRTAGLCVLMLAVALSNLPKKGEKINGKLLLMCAMIFVLNGFVSVVSKEHQVQAALPTVSSTEFVMLSGIAKALIAGVALLISGGKKKEQAERQKPNVKIILPLIASSAVIGGVSYLLQLLGAKNLPATVLYPFITGGSMVFSSIIGILVFRERPSKSVLISIGLCFVGTLMFL